MGRPAGSPLVLCVDDQETGLKIRKLFLESFGYEVLTAPSAEAGLEIIEREPVDALVLDYRMPGMSGSDMVALLKRSRPHLPIILLSGYAAEIPQDVRQQVSAFITKGGAPQELLQALEKSLGAAPARRPQVHADIIDHSRELASQVDEHLEKVQEHVAQGKRVVSENVARVERRLKNRRRA